MVPAWLRWPSKPRGNEADDREDGDGRAVLVRILIAIVWMPIQITLSLVFATGGIFFVLILGVVLGPFVGAFFLIRHLLREGSGQPEPSPGLEVDRASEDDRSDHAPLRH